LACRGELRSPISGHPPDAPTIETIVLVTFYEIIIGEFLRVDSQAFWEQAGIEIIGFAPAI
jgi:hypothetical protein